MRGFLADVRDGSPDDPLNPDFLRKLEYLRVLARKVHTGRFSALQRSRKLGRGIDFADHRPYTPGDDFKDIDWNLYGRLDRFMVRLAEEETELNLYLLVDCSKSMSPQKAGACTGASTAPRTHKRSSGRLSVHESVNPPSGASGKRLPSLP